jgi:hypothetical protein
MREAADIVELRGAGLLIVTSDGSPLHPRQALEIDRHCQRWVRVNAMSKGSRRGRDAASRPPSHSRRTFGAGFNSKGSDLKLLPSWPQRCSIESSGTVAVWTAISPHAESLSKWRHGSGPMGHEGRGIPERETMSIELSWLWLLEPGFHD